MAVRKLTAALLAGGALVATSLLGLTTSASASAQPTDAARAAARAADALARAQQHATVATPAKVVSPRAAAFACSYLYVCGQGSNGNSFAYTKCNTLYELPNLVGTGPLINNQSPGTTAYFYDKNENYLFYSTAYESTTRDWTPVWYAIAC